VADCGGQASLTATEKARDAAQAAGDALAAEKDALFKQLAFTQQTLSDAERRIEELKAALAASERTAAETGREHSALAAKLSVCCPPQPDLCTDGHCRRRSTRCVRRPRRR
jgi:hypothetical protein